MPDRKCKGQGGVAPMTAASSASDARGRLGALCAAALDAVDPDRCLPAHHSPLATEGRLLRVGAGKSLAPMPAAAERQDRALDAPARVGSFLTPCSIE